jgi:hypothetical protein
MKHISIVVKILVHTGGGCKVIEGEKSRLQQEAADEEQTAR